MYLLILESIGTSELLMIAVAALIIFGPRKLPEMMRTFGKAMNEFRRSTNEFKQSWEKEVGLEDFEMTEPDTKKLPENSIGQNSVKSEIITPEIKEIKQEDFEKAFPMDKNGVADRPDEPITEKTTPVGETEETVPDKRNWL